MQNEILTDDEFIDRSINNYVITRAIGRGGFARVYQAKSKYIEREIAVKIIMSPITSWDDQEQFLKEARIIQGFSHPNIIRLHDCGIHEHLTRQGRRVNLAYLMMDLASGTLKERHPRGQRVALAILLSYLQQVAEALQYAHDYHDRDGQPHCVLHLDVKPANMLISSGGQIWLSDFGIAVAGHQSQRLSRVLGRGQEEDDVVLGSPEYMAPERFRGEDHRASDQYSLAVVVYEWLSGELPFRSLARDPNQRAQDLANQHLHQPPPRLSDRFPDVTPAIEGVLFKALSKDPGLRYPSVRDFAQAFARSAQEAARQRGLSPGALPGEAPLSASSLPPSSAPSFSPPPPSFSPPPPFSLQQPPIVLAGAPLSGGPPAPGSTTYQFGLGAPATPAAPSSTWSIFSGDTRFLRQQRARLYRVASYLAIGLAGGLLLLSLLPLWYVILPLVLVALWLFRQAVSRVNHLWSTLLLLPVALYYGWSLWATLQALLHLFRATSPVLLSLLIFLIPVLTAFYVHRRYIRERLRW